MKPVSPVVPGWNLKETVFAKHQPPYIPLPTICLPGGQGMVISRWSLSWKERIQVLFGGSVWLQVLTFGRPLQPVKLSSECPLFVSKHEQSEESSHA